MECKAFLRQKALRPLGGLPEEAMKGSEVPGFFV